MQLIEIKCRLMKKTELFWGIFLFFFFSCCSDNCDSEKYTTITTFKQKDKNPKYIYQVVKLDAVGNVLQKISYDDNGTIRKKETNFYDSAYKKDSTLINYFALDAKKSTTITVYFFYNEKGLLDKTISIHHPSEKYFTTFYSYLPNKNLISQTKHIHSKNGLDLYREGFINYYYNKKDSLIKTISTDLDGKNGLVSDSIIYEDDKKIEYIKGGDTMFINRETFFKNNEIIKQIEYIPNYVAKKSDINSILTYEYKNNYLVKMTEKFHSGEITYTYIYANKNE